MLKYPQSEPCSPIAGHLLQLSMLKPPTTRSKAFPKHRHHVYVVLLDDKVLNERSFRKANPDFQFNKACLYVGMTGLTPELRLARHKAGIKGNRFVQAYGLKLVPQFYAVFNPMPLEAAQEMEVELAIGLREEGYAVWQA